MRRVLAHIGLAEVVAAIGLTLVGTGVAMVYVPAALIVTGGALLALAIWRL